MNKPQPEYLKVLAEEAQKKRTLKKIKKITKIVSLAAAIGLVSFITKSRIEIQTTNENTSTTIPASSTDTLYQLDSEPNPENLVLLYQEILDQRITGQTIQDTTNPRRIIEIKLSDTGFILFDSNKISIWGPNNQYQFTCDIDQNNRVICPTQTLRDLQLRP
jgi:preprotein translocase subunit YajC